ncbi:uncharacterized protein AMSG_07508 [Thecamonas trahens ATCC 50062]|uniref:Uncharacterized protein n=1 Tax=Thecamonas trahens ATCC 50062 TaxID=461836 RepID=A0A0L0DHC9_THETB|nr:hypothetical protein AMSG_07508 [Thecamonas trahens ATCC 50062]KNC51600.1 hypothetical protein AMSG_07508 [Thecamonas trahens ATCC 50062]|eukprot:XP_013755998.1 hypothetical protein AMSG_07508 [Thecamonas trahens ATCC 50062]
MHPPSVTLLPGEAQAVCSVADVVVVAAPRAGIRMVDPLLPATTLLCPLQPLAPAGYGVVVGEALLVAGPYGSVVHIDERNSARAVAAAVAQGADSPIITAASAAVGAAFAASDSDSDDDKDSNEGSDVEHATADGLGSVIWRLLPPPGLADRGPPAGALALDPDTARLLLFWRDGEALVLDAVDGLLAATTLELTAAAPNEFVYAACSIPSSHRIVTAHPGAVRVWETAGLTLVGELARPSGSGSFRTTALAAHGGAVYGGASDGSVVCWDLESRAVQWRACGEPVLIAALVLVPALNGLITGGADGRLVFWDLGTPDSPPSAPLVATPSLGAPLAALLLIGPAIVIAHLHNATVHLIDFTTASHSLAADDCVGHLADGHASSSGST